MTDFLRMKWLIFGNRSPTMRISLSEASMRQGFIQTCSVFVDVISVLWKDLTPRVFPLLVSAPSPCRTGDSNSCPPVLELGALTKWLVKCHAASVTQPDRLTWSCDQASHVLRHHLGVITVERPDPKGLSNFSQCTESLPHRGFKLMSSRLELGAPTKWLASRC